jgi:hypothetical protein
MSKRCPICREAFKKYSVVYFDRNNVFYHVPCVKDLTNMKGIGWLNAVPELHPFPPLE